MHERSTAPPTRGWKSPKLLVFVLVTLLVVALDQITKLLVVHNLRYLHDEIRVIPGFFSIIHVQNPGATFGFLAGQPTSVRMAVFGVFTVVAVGVLLSILRQLDPDDRFNAAMLGLILGGALGNAVDRVVKQQVTDFLKVYVDYPPIKDWLVAHFHTNEYPTFNVADSAIVVGVLLFLGYYLFADRADDGEDPAILEEGPSPGADGSSGEQAPRAAR